MNPVNVSTKRTTVNVTVVTALIGLIARATGWKLQVNADDLVLLAPAFGVLLGIGYRGSRWVTGRWPQLGWVLFGSSVEPSGVRTIEAPGGGGRAS